MCQILHADAIEAMERNMNIVRGRIMKSLRATIEKLEVAVCLELFIQNQGELIRNIVTPEELEEIHTSVVKYGGTGRISMHMTTRSLKDSSTNLDTTKIDPRLSNTVNMLYNKEKIKHFSHCQANAFSTPAILFLNTFKDLVECIRKKIYTSSIDKLNYEKTIGHLWKINNIQKIRIADREAILYALENDLELKKTEGNIEIDQYRHHLYQLQDSNRKEIQQIINASEKSMATNALVSNEKTYFLKEEASFTEKEYEDLLTRHLKEEKLLRSKRNKVETNLANWLARYDQEIGELFEEHESVLKVYNEKKKGMDELQDRFDKQEEIYIKCMEEKTLEEQRVFDERYVQLTQWYSAKRIQNWWRMIVFKRIKAKLKGKGKKGKKKK